MKPHSEMPKVHFLTTIVWFSYISKDVGVRSEKARISLQGYFISLNGKEQKVSRPEKLIQAFKAKSSSAVRNQLRAGSKASQRSRHQKRSENSQEQKHRDRFFPFYRFLIIGMFLYSLTNVVWYFLVSTSGAIASKNRRVNKNKRKIQAPSVVPGCRL
jgi:hypothetical protein